MESACVFVMKFQEKRGHLYGLTLLARWKRNRIQFSPEKRPISGLFSLKIITDVKLLLNSGFRSRQRTEKSLLYVMHM